MTPPQVYQQRGARAERDELITSHLYLVRHVLGRLRLTLPAGTDREALESAGALGLVEAAGKFDPSKGIQFKTYAYNRIRGAILDELRRNNPLPQHMAERTGALREILASGPGPVTLRELSERSGLSEGDVEQCLAALQFTRICPLEKAPEAAVASRDRPDGAAEEQERKELLARAVASLPERQRLIVTLYYLEDLRLREIGKLLDLSESRVSRLLSEALLRLRNYILAREQ